MVRTRKGRADGCGNTESHRTHAAGRKEVTRNVVAEKLRRPHLLLSDIRDDNRLALRGTVNRLDNLLGHYDILVHRPVRHGALLLPLFNMRKPLPVLCRPDARIDCGEDILHVRDDSEIDGDILADGAGVAIHMYDLCPLCVCGKLAGDAIGEADAKGDYEISLVDGMVCGRRSVHSGEPERERIAFIEGAKPHERRRHGNLRLVGKVGDILRRTGRNHAAAGIENRPLRLVHELGEASHLGGGRHGLRMICPERNALGILRRGHGLLNVFRDVDNDRTRLAVRSYIERLGDDLRNFISMLHKEAVLSDRTADTAHIRLLERIGADLRKRDLPGDAHKRDAVHVGGGKTRDGVGSPWAGSHKANARLSRRTRIAVGHMHASLFMPPQHKLERRVRQAVENVQDSPARISEEHFRARFGQRSNKGLCARSFVLLHHHFSLSFCNSHARAARSPRAALERMRHSIAFFSSAFMPSPF